MCYCSPWKLFTSLTFVLICEMSTFVLIFKVRCCSSVHLISVKGPLLCPVLFPLCSVCSVHPQPSFYSAFDSPTPRCRNGSLLPVCQALSLFKLTFFTSLLTVMDLHRLCPTQLMLHYPLGNCRRLSPKCFKTMNKCIRDH